MTHRQVYLLERDSHDVVDIVQLDKVVITPEEDGHMQCAPEFILAHSRANSTRNHTRVKAGFAPVFAILLPCSPQLLEAGFAVSMVGFIQPSVRVAQRKKLSRAGAAGLIPRGGVPL